MTGLPADAPDPESLAAYRPRCPQPGGLGNWTGHLPFADALVRALRPRRVVELGTHYGESLFGLFEAVEATGAGGEVHAVDTWTGEDHAGIYGEDVYASVLEYKKTHDKRGKLKLHRKTFDEAAAQFPKESIDLLHLDGLHTYEAVCHDLAVWLPKIRPGGFLLLHDVCEERAGFGVRVCWDELPEADWEKTVLPHSHGLGVARRRGAAPEEAASWLDALFGEEPVHGELIGRFVEAGKRLDDRLSRRTLEQALEAERSKVRQRDDRLRELEAHVRNLEPLVGEVERLREAVEAVDTAHDQLEAFCIATSGDVLAQAGTRVAVGESIEAMLDLDPGKTGSAGALLRLDPASRPCWILLRALTVSADSGEGWEQLFTVSEANDWLQWRSGADCFVPEKRQPLRLLATGPDPQLVWTRPLPAGVRRLRLNLMLDLQPTLDGFVRQWIDVRAERDILQRELKALKAALAGVRADFQGLLARRNDLEGWADTLARQLTALQASEARYRHLYEAEYRRRQALRRSPVFKAVRPLLPAEARRPMNEPDLPAAVLPPGPAPNPVHRDYGLWLAAFDAEPQLPQGDAEGDDPPVITVVMPVYQPDLEWLDEAVESLRAQTWPHWRAILVDDASPDPAVAARLEEWTRQEPRLSVIQRETNGHIAAATQTGIDAVDTPWIGFLDQDDRLHPRGLATVAGAIQRHPEVRLLYSDEDKLDANGHRTDPFFKPDWDPDRLLTQNYVNHLTVLATGTVRSAGGLRPGFDGSQDWDLLLRVTANLEAPAILHLPAVLYHWRMTPGSAAESADAKPYTRQAAGRALDEAVHTRFGNRARVEANGLYWRIRHLLPDPPPSVELIILTRDNLGCLKTGLDRLLAGTRYPDTRWTVRIVDNGSADPALHTYFADLENHPRIRLDRDAGPFNYAGLNNAAVARSDAGIIVFLNDDVLIGNPDWLIELVAQASRPEIGAVGTRMTFPDGRIQHGGVVLGIGGIAGHALKYFPGDTDAAASRLQVVHRVSAVTGACLAVRRSTFETVGGFDADGLPIAFNDIDLCLRIREAGYANLFTPFAAMTHYESVSRGPEDSPEKLERFGREITVMRERWGDLLYRDPYYNPNLTLEHEDFSYAVPPRTRS
ncbi:MAG: glycosyltransferase [Opitutales bacterium]